MIKLNYSLIDIFKIRKNEVGKIFYFFIFAILLQAGIAIGESIANSLFLINIGYKKLPIVYMLTPLIILILYLPSYFYFIKKYSEDSFFKTVLLFLVTINIILFLCIKFLPNTLPPNIFSLLYYLILLYTTIWSIALYTLFWNFLDGFFDIQDAKRVFPIFSAGTAIGAIIGGSLISILTKYIDAISLLLVWSIFAILSYLFLTSIKKKFKKNILQEDNNEENISIVNQLTTMINNMRTSKYVLVLFLLFFLSIILATLLEFEYMNILSKGETEESLASLFGKLFAIVNIFNLLVNLFFFNRLVLSYGVRNILLIQPIIYLLSFVYLSFSMSFEAGLFSFFVIQGILVSIDYNNQNFLYNGIKANIKYQVRTFVENLAEPLGIAFTGLFLFIVSSKITPYEIAFIGILFTLIYLLLSIILRFYYPKAMIDNLKSYWLDFTKNEKELISNLNDTELKQLDTYLMKRTTKELALSILYHNDTHKTIKLLLSHINHTKSVPKDLLNSLLNSNDSEIPKIIIEWIDINIDDLDITIIKELGIFGFIPIERVNSLLYSDNPTLQSSASVVMLSSQYPNNILEANRVINRLIKQSNVDALREGIYILGESRHREYTFFLVQFLEHSNFSIRREALEAIYKLCDKTSSKVVHHILKRFKNGNWIERDISLSILSRIKDSQYIIPLFKNTIALQPNEKRKINSLISGLGLQTIPSIVTVLVEDRFSYSSRAIAGRILGNLSFTQFKALEKELILNEIRKSYEFLNFFQTIQKLTTKDDNLILLSLFYRDNQNLILEFILELLTIGGGLPDFEMIKTAINSNNPNSKANALETIEQSTGREIFTLLRPLIDGRDIDHIMSFYRSKYTIDNINIEKIIEVALHSNNSLELEIILEVIYTRNDSYLTKFREKLRDKVDTEVQNSIFNLIKNGDKYGTIKKLQILIKHHIFQRFNIFELHMVLRDSSIVHLKKDSYLYKHKESVTNIYILLDGEAYDEQNSYLNGDIIGFSTITNRDIESDVICKTDTKLLRLNINSIIDAIYAYPKIGIEFLILKGNQHEKL